MGNGKVQYFFSIQPTRDVGRDRQTDRQRQRETETEYCSLSHLEDDVVGLHGVRARERWAAGQQLKHEDAHGPVVGGVVMALVEDDLGSHVLGRAAERPRLPPRAYPLGEPEVYLKGRGQKLAVHGLN